MRRSLWPKTKFAETNSIAAQLDHILSEIDEAAEASELLGADAVLLADRAPAAALLPLFRELGDIQGSIETLWHILDRLFGSGFSEEMVLAWIEEKNRKRGYYVEETSPFFTAGIPAKIEPDALYAVLCQPSAGYAVGSLLRGADCNWRSIGILGHAKLPARMTAAEMNRLRRCGNYDNLKAER